jgi:hypothetical protein
MQRVSKVLPCKLEFAPINLLFVFDQITTAVFPEFLFFFFDDDVVLIVAFFSSFLCLFFSLSAMLWLSRMTPFFRISLNFSFVLYLLAFVLVVLPMIQKIRWRFCRILLLVIGTLRLFVDLVFCLLLISQYLFLCLRSATTTLLLFLPFCSCNLHLVCCCEQ